MGANKGQKRSKSGKNILLIKLVHEDVAIRRIIIKFQLQLGLYYIY